MPGTPAGGLRGAARQVVANLLEIGRTRLELFVLELEEERLRLARMWIGAVVTLFLLFVGLVLASAAFVLWCAPENRLIALIALAGVFLAAAAMAAWRWKRLAQSPTPLLHATLGELKRDQETMSQGGTPP